VSHSQDELSDDASGVQDTYMRRVRSRLLCLTIPILGSDTARLLFHSFSETCREYFSRNDTHLSHLYKEPDTEQIVTFTEWRLELLQQLIQNHTLFLRVGMSNEFVYSLYLVLDSHLGLPLRSECGSGSDSFSLVSLRKQKRLPEQWMPVYFETIFPAVIRYIYSYEKVTKTTDIENIISGNTAFVIRNKKRSRCMMQSQPRSKYAVTGTKKGDAIRSSPQEFINSLSPQAFQWVWKLIATCLLGNYVHCGYRPPIAERRGIYEMDKQNLLRMAFDADGVNLFRNAIHEYIVNWLSTDTIQRTILEHFRCLNFPLYSRNVRSICDHLIRGRYWHNRLPQLERGARAHIISTRRSHMPTSNKTTLRKKQRIVPKQEQHDQTTPSLLTASQVTQPVSGLVSSNEIKQWFKRGNYKTPIKTRIVVYEWLYDICITQCKRMRGTGNEEFCICPIEYSRKHDDIYLDKNTGFIVLQKLGISQEQERLLQHVIDILPREMNLDGIAMQLYQDMSHKTNTCLQLAIIAHYFRLKRTLIPLTQDYVTKLQSTLRRVYNLRHFEDVSQITTPIFFCTACQIYCIKYKKCKPRINQRFVFGDNGIQCVVCGGTWAGHSDTSAISSNNTIIEVDMLRHGIFLVQTQSPSKFINFASSIAIMCPGCACITYINEHWHSTEATDKSKGVIPGKIGTLYHCQDCCTKNYRARRRGLMSMTNAIAADTRVGTQEKRHICLLGEKISRTRSRLSVTYIDDNTMEIKQGVLCDIHYRPCFDKDVYFHSYIRNVIKRH